MPDVGNPLCHHYPPAQGVAHRLLDHFLQEASLNLSRSIFSLSPKSTGHQNDNIFKITTLREQNTPYLESQILRVDKGLYCCLSSQSLQNLMKTMVFLPRKMHIYTYIQLLHIVLGIHRACLFYPLRTHSV